MKKIVSLLLVVAMLFSMSSVAFAAEIYKQEPVLLEEYVIETGTYYSYSLHHSNEEWLAIVFMPNDGRDVSFTAASLDEEHDDIYDVALERTRASDPLGYLRAGFSSLEEADTIDIDSFVSEVEADLPAMTRGAVENQLKNDLREIYGNEYERVVYRNLTYPEIDEIAIHEDLVYRCHKQGDMIFEIGTGLSAASIALSKFANVSIRLSVLALVVSLGGELINALSPVDVYILDADFGRWTTIDDGSYVYTMTNKIYRHYGLDNTSNDEPAYLDEEETSEPIYNPSEAYYRDYSAQAADAYQNYLQMN